MSLVVYTPGMTRVSFRDEERAISRGWGSLSLPLPPLATGLYYYRIVAENGSGLSLGKTGKFFIVN
jgi:hypothetical protein